MRATAFALILFISSVAVAQTTRNVPAQFATIQSAIAASANGDTVLVAPGTYNGAINFLGKAITVTSSGGPTATTISGTSAGRVVTFANNETAASVLSGFTIKNGNGGIDCTRSSPTISNCTLTQNAGVLLEGGAILVRANLASTTAAPTITNCRMTNNASANQGGAIKCDASNNGTVSASFVNCTITNNFATNDGGAISLIGLDTISPCSASFTGCTISNNAANLSGGAMYCERIGLVTMTSCRITENTAGYGDGGAVRISLAGANGGSLRAINCLFALNDSGGLGGAIRIAFGSSAQSLTVEGCTLIGNTANFTGGGLSVANIGGSSVSVVSSIVWGNSLPSIHCDIFNAVAVSSSCIEPPFFTSNATNLLVDPHFVDQANGDYHLATNSPCIGTGTVGPFALPTTDLDGTPRQVGTIDMGADEVPTLALPGSGDDLDLYAWINGAGDPLASTLASPAGSTVTFTMKSPGGTLNGALPLLAGEFYVPATPPIGLIAYPYVHLDNGPAFVIEGTFGSSPFYSPGLDPAGITLTTLVPTGLAGFGVRLQGFAVTPFVANGVFAASNAHDLLF